MWYGHASFTCNQRCGQLRRSLTSFSDGWWRKTSSFITSSALKPLFCIWWPSQPVQVMVVDSDAEGCLTRAVSHALIADSMHSHISSQLILRKCLKGNVVTDFCRYRENTYFLCSSCIRNYLPPSAISELQKHPAPRIYIHTFTLFGKFYMTTTIRSTSMSKWLCPVPCISPLNHTYPHIGIFLPSRILHDEKLIALNTKMWTE